MKSVFLFAISVCVAVFAFAQQPYNHNKMVFAPTNKPNTIIYNDTIYKGSSQFKNLFLRTGNVELAMMYKEHQTNKITGNIITTIGTVATIVGVSEATRSGGNNTVGWLVTGGGLVATITGGYFILVGQQRLIAATELFNKRYATKATAGVGITNNGIGVVVKF
jgi:arginine deiminase